MTPPPSLVVLEYLDLDTPALALPTSSLDSAERERAARFHFDEDRRRFIHGRAWLRLRVAELLGIDPKAVEFTTIGERGKPAVVGTAPTFNLSHSAHYGLLAIHADGLPLGVDIELARPFERAARIAARHFNAAEAAAVAAAPEGPEREAVFFRTWTRKEAYLKLTSLGLPGGLACVETGTEAAARALLVPAEHGLASAWVTSLELPASAPTGLLAALAAPCAVAVNWRSA
jgi:4'-phosphopantetheinyl transferase